MKNPENYKVRKCDRCKKEVKVGKIGEGWEKHGDIFYCSRCAIIVNREQEDTRKEEDYRYP